MNSIYSSSGLRSSSSNISATTIAPALMKGFLGIPFSSSSWIMELKAVPEGSFPTLLHIDSPLMERAIAKESTFEILWMEKVTSASIKG